MEERNVFPVGVSAEEMKALYFNATQLRESNYYLWQLNVRGERYYCVENEPGKTLFFPSVTTILRKVMPENKFLTEWKLSLGKEESAAYTMERANYGTFIHGQLARLMISRKYNLDEVREELCKYVEREKLPVGFVDAHEEEAKADIKAFATWMWEYDVIPYAIEISLYSPTMGIAGMIDLVCNMRECPRSDESKAIEKAKGDSAKLAMIEEKFSARLNAIVDFKSGKKGFYDEYAIQLELYRRMWNENYPDTPIDRIFNVAPKDWMRTVNKKPSFSFEEQTKNPVLRKVDALLNLFFLEEPEEKKVTIVSGMIDLDNPEGNVEIYSLAELVALRKKEDEEPLFAEE